MISRTTEVTGFFAGCCAQTMTADSNIRQVLEARFMRPPILLLNLPESGTNSCATQHKQNVPAKDDCKSSAALHLVPVEKPMAVIISVQIMKMSNAVPRE